MKEYKIPLARTLYGYSYVKADNLKEAIKVSLTGAGDGEFIREEGFEDSSADPDEKVDLKEIVSVNKLSTNDMELLKQLVRYKKLNAN